MSYGERILDGFQKESASGRSTFRETVSNAYAQFRDGIHRHLMYLGADSAVSQELTQDAFLKLFLALSEGQEIQNIRAWLLTVTTRQWLNAKREQRHLAVLDADQAAARLAELIEPGADPEAAVLQREQALAVWRAIGALNEQQRICLHLRAEGLAYREIGGILGVSNPTVTRLLRRAVEEIRNVIYG